MDPLWCLRIVHIDVRRSVDPPILAIVLVPLDIHHKASKDIALSAMWIIFTWRTWQWFRWCKCVKTSCAKLSSQIVTNAIYSKQILFVHVQLQLSGCLIFRADANKSPPGYPPDIRSAIGCCSHRLGSYLNVKQQKCAYYSHRIRLLIVCFKHINTTYIKLNNGIVTIVIYSIQILFAHTRQTTCVNIIHIQSI